MIMVSTFGGIKIFKDVSYEFLKVIYVFLNTMCLIWYVISNTTRIFLQLLHYNFSHS